MIEDQRRVAAGAQQMLLRRDFPQILIAGGADERQVAMALDQIPASGIALVRRSRAPRFRR